MPLTHPITVDAPDSPAAADRARDQARRVRAQCDAARADAARIVAAAREQLAAAERRGAGLTEAVWLAEQIADDLDTRGRVIDHGRSFGLAAEQSEWLAEALGAELAALTETADDLDRRLGEIAAQRETVAAELDGAREAGDVPAVTSLRPQLAALDEVAADLGTRLSAADARIRQIGAPDAEGLLAGALSDARSNRARHTEFLAQWLDSASLDPQTRSALAAYLGHTGRATGEIEASHRTALLAVLTEEPVFAAVLDSACSPLESP